MAFDDKHLLPAEARQHREFVWTTPYLYPVLMGIHVLGLALLTGPAIAVDLRLIGLARRAIPMTLVAKYLLPICHVGLGVVAVTGMTMFCAIALAVEASAVPLGRPRSSRRQG